MNKQDAQYLDDPRTVALANELGTTPERVVEAAEAFAEQDGETVDQELDEGVEEVIGE
jgi:hypothetical protein